MVRGLVKFRDQFRSHAGQYVLIGGAACDLFMEEAGLQFRATKDLDIVLCVEALNASLTPIPVDEEISSLSAILLDNVYYSTPTLTPPLVRKTGCSSLGE